MDINPYDNIILEKPKTSAICRVIKRYYINGHTTLIIIGEDIILSNNKRINKIIYKHLYRHHYFYELIFFFFNSYDENLDEIMLSNFFLVYFQNCKIIKNQILNDFIY